MSPKLRKILSVGIYVGFLALFVEIALQAFYYVTAGAFLFQRVSPAIYAPNPHSGVFNRANLELVQDTHEFSATYHTNSQGLRVAAPGREYTLQKPNGSYRIMLLGPSFAYGWGVDYENSFAALLARRLEAGEFADGAHVEVINAGVPSLPPAPHLRWYREVGRGYAPDLVIQFIYGSMLVGNDPVPDASVDERGHLVPRNLTWAQRTRTRAKEFATVFYAWVLWTKFDAMIDNRDEEPGSTVLGAGRELVSASVFDPDRDDVREALEFYEDLQKSVAEGGSDLLVVYFPLSYAVHPEDTSRWRHLGVRDVPSQIAFDAAFADHLRSIGVPTQNITSALRSAADTGQRLYYWLDIHWTATGNEVAARAVAEHLLAAGPPPRRSATSASELEVDEGSLGERP